MADADYRSCDVCGAKTFYDHDLDYQKPDADHPVEWWLRDVGDWKVICQKCAETHEVVVIPLAPPPEPEDAEETERAINAYVRDAEIRGYSAGRRDERNRE